MKLSVKVNEGYFDKELVNVLKKNAQSKNLILHEGTGAGSEFLGWVNLPGDLSTELIDEISSTAQQISSKIDIMLVIGIGGSYLGAKAVIEALSDNFSQLKREGNAPLVIFAGQNLSEDYIFELRELLKERSFGITVISKSGTTTEPAVAFRIFKNDLEAKYGKEEARKRIIAITDQSKGALKKMADIEGFKTFVIPDNVGGRYSVLTPVGLFPVAVAGFDIHKLIAGARDMYNRTKPEIDGEENIAVLYAAYRNYFYSKNLDIEILVNYNPKLHFFTEWWKQLYGESEGKQGKGIFPAGVDFTSDLHSMGQYIQEGRRNLFETVLSVTNTQRNVVLPADDENLDGLNFLAGKRIDEINKSAELGTILAHIDGGVPNIVIEIPQLNEFSVGQLIYFFEKACGISGYMLGVNPFDQPGVEAYKINMFALSGKKGYEAQRELLLKK